MDIGSLFPLVHFRILCMPLLPKQQAEVSWVERLHDETYTHSHNILHESRIDVTNMNIPTNTFLAKAFAETFNGVFTR